MPGQSDLLTAGPPGRGLHWLDQLRPPAQPDRGGDRGPGGGLLLPRHQPRQHPRTPRHAEAGPEEESGDEGPATALCPLGADHWLQAR